MLMNPDLILSVDGIKLRTVEDVQTALSLARPKRDIEFVIMPLHDPAATRTVVVKFPPNWWQAASKK